MAGRKRAKKQDEGGIAEGHDLATPLWQAYYRRVRRSIRFPRYYKKAVNA